MKALHDFANDQDRYNDYLRAYFAAQIMNPVGSNRGNAENAVQKAEALVRALAAFIPDDNNFDY